MTRTGREQLRVGIVGCGLIGNKRADALTRDRLVACHDVAPGQAEALAARTGAKACPSLVELLDEQLDVVVVATVHSELAPLACAALEAGCHVLVEKPAGTASADVARIEAAANAAGRRVKVGFNHRFHPGIATAITRAASGEFGPVLYLRARYGHGGRLGYEQEWRCDPKISGGGEIVDQGMHLLDLSYWLLGELPLHSALLRTQFWQADVDDNAVLVLGSPGGVGDASPFSLLHVSWTEWKNTFSLEIACRSAKFAVDGLVRSYGPQRLTVYEMGPELGPPRAETVTYEDHDDSWSAEWEHFAAAIADGGPLLGDLASARYAWSCVEQAQGR